MNWSIGVSAEGFHFLLFNTILSDIVLLVNTYSDPIIGKPRLKEDHDPRRLRLYLCWYAGFRHRIRDGEKQGEK